MADGVDRRRWLGSCVLGALLSLASSALADDLEVIRRTQIQIRLADRQFQATVIDRDGDRLTVLTAAHCLGPDSVGAPLRMKRGGDEGLRGEVVAVSRNPAYEPVDAGNGMVRRVLGIDNAIALIRAKPVGATEANRLLQIQPAELAPRSALGIGQRVITIHVVDQHGREHAIRAGNHLNPKCLAWGNESYRPAQGDSGSGVFLLIPGPGDEVRPLLIGNVAISDERGGIAPLINRRDLWVELDLDHDPVNPASMGSEDP